jgi:hypothetical protein
LLYSPCIDPVKKFSPEQRQEYLIDLQNKADIFNSNAYKGDEDLVSFALLMNPSLSSSTSTSSVSIQTVEKKMLQLPIQYSTSSNEELISIYTTGDVQRKCDMLNTLYDDLTILSQTNKHDPTIGQFITKLFQAYIHDKQQTTEALHLLVQKRSIVTATKFTNSTLTLCSFISVIQLLYHMDILQHINECFNELDITNANNKHLTPKEINDDLLTTYPMSFILKYIFDTLNDDKIPLIHELVVVKLAIQYNQHINWCRYEDSGEIMNKILGTLFDEVQYQQSMYTFESVTTWQPPNENDPNKLQQIRTNWKYMQQNDTQIKINSTNPFVVHISPTDTSFIASQPYETIDTILTNQNARSSNGIGKRTVNHVSLELP